MCGRVSVCLCVCVECKTIPTNYFKLHNFTILKHIYFHVHSIPVVCSKLLDLYFSLIKGCVQMAWISKRDHAAGVTGREDLVSEEVKEGMMVKNCFSLDLIDFNWSLLKINLCICNHKEFVYSKEMSRMRRTEQSFVRKKMLLLWQHSVRYTCNKKGHFCINLYTGCLQLKC